MESRAEECGRCKWMKLELYAKKELTMLRCMHADALSGAGRILELDLTEYATRAAFLCRRPEWCMKGRLKEEGESDR